MERVDRDNLVDVEPAMPDKIVAPAHRYLPFVPTKLSIGEIFAGLTILYFASIAAFNAGYFLRIPGRFSELFAFTDLIGANIAIVQYFVTNYFLVSLVVIGVAIFLNVKFPELPKWIERVAVRCHTTAEVGIVIFIIVLFIGLLGFAVVGVLQDVFQISYLTMALLPFVFLQGTFLYVNWIGYRHSQVTLLSLVWSVLFVIFTFAFNSGVAWLKHDTISTDGIQSIIFQGGICLDRKILRTSSNGVLLFNPSLTSFEFRNKDTFRTVFDKNGCF